jgi:hypothetical protein
VDTTEKQNSKSTLSILNISRTNKKKEADCESSCTFFFIEKKKLCIFSVSLIKHLSSILKVNPAIYTYLNLLNNIKKSSTTWYNNTSLNYNPIPYYEFMETNTKGSKLVKVLPINPSGPPIYSQEYRKRS